ncbi:hypothetical protein CWB41_11630 [Methylovirgula ligni]|nr:hypothetical protein CWB41_11630 [Methylovirgula ligni]
MPVVPMMPMVPVIPMVPPGFLDQRRGLRRSFAGGHARRCLDDTCGHCRSKIYYAKRESEQVNGQRQFMYGSHQHPPVDRSAHPGFNRANARPKRRRGPNRAV